MGDRLPEPEDVRLARAVMERHYRMPVQPIERYCDQLALYADALDYAIEHHDPRFGGSCGPFGTVEDATTVRDGLRLLNLWGRQKSALLGRLMYGDEPLRTTPCPEHKGRWSGLEWTDNRCVHGCGLTGWLPNAAPGQSQNEATT